MDDNPMKHQQQETERGGGEFSSMNGDVEEKSTKTMSSVSMNGHCSNIGSHSDAKATAPAGESTCSVSSNRSLGGMSAQHHELSSQEKMGMSNTATMEEVGHLMREQDAELLESHHARGANETNVDAAAAAAAASATAPQQLVGARSSNNFTELVSSSGTTTAAQAATGTTTSSSSTAAALSINSCSAVSAAAASSLVEQVSLVRQLSTDSSRSLTKGPPPATPTSRKRLNRLNSRTTSERSLFDDNNQLEQQQQQYQQEPLSPTSSSHHHHLRRPTLSGQVFQQDDDGTSVTAASTTHTARPGLVVDASAMSAMSLHAGGGVGGDAASIGHNSHSHHAATPAGAVGTGAGVGGDAGSVVVVSVGGSENNLLAVEKLVRTESMDRRLNEMAQFAEAVGDVPNTVELHIDEEDRSDDDDDDSTATAATVVTTPLLPPMVAVTTTTTTTTTVAAAAAAAAVASSAVSPHPPSVITERRDFCDLFASSSSHQHAADQSYTGGEVNIPTTAATTTTTTTRPKIRPPWPFRSHHRSGFLDQLPDQTKQQDFIYKGIVANPPEIVKSGSQRGNYAQLHRKAWLEVSDKYHRYGKNLRLYYRYWERLGFPTNQFFDWLDSKGEAAGQPLPELEECPRATLDSDCVLYITNPEITRGYAVQFIRDPATGRGHVVDVDGEIVTTGPDGWIFVLRDNVVYGAQKITSATPGHRSKQRFHHSSFFGGKAVAAAGIFITDDDGFLTRLYPHSGHYRPGEAHIQRMLFFMHQMGVDLRTFEMDMQQILHVAREKDKTNKENNNNAAASAPSSGGAAPVVVVEKKKKVESLYLMPAVIVACYLAHKARFIGQGIFTQIHKIGRTDASNVTEALRLIDGPDSGGLCSSEA